MANIVFKLGQLDLSGFVRVNQGEGLDPGRGDMLEPSFSDSPFFEGQFFTSLDAKNREMVWPLYLHPSSSPYLQDGLNQLVAKVNQQLRLTTDIGLVQYVQWQNAQASNPTFYSLQFGRFEPNFNFRVSEKGWLAGNLHLWVLPYGHTATERIFATYAAPANQGAIWVPPASIVAGAGGTVLGDAPPQWDIRMTTGSYLADDGRIGVFSALPQASYVPIIPVGSFFGLHPSAGILGASGAYASQFLAMDQQAAGATSGYSYFSFAISPGSVYTGDNRVLGLVRARSAPFGLRAFGPDGQPLGATVIASAMDGYQLVDYGILRAAAWDATAPVTIQSYAGPDYSASGMFSPRRAAPAWSQEHGPIFVLPAANTILSLDWNSPAVAIDGFDQASGALLNGQLDMLGNQWSLMTGLASGAQLVGTSRLVGDASYSTNYTVGTYVQGDLEVEAVFTAASGFAGPVAVGRGTAAAFGFAALGGSPPSLRLYNYLTTASMAITPVPGPYHLKVTFRGSQMWANLAGPSGAYAGSASGALASLGLPWAPLATSTFGAPMLSVPALVSGPTVMVESFRARSLASTGYKSRDILRVDQPHLYHTRQDPSANDAVDLQGRQRGALQALALPAPSLGAGFFFASFPYDQGPSNDLLNVDIRCRERFTYAR